MLVLRGGIFNEIVFGHCKINVLRNKSMLLCVDI